MKKFEVGKEYTFRVYENNGFEYSTRKIQIASRNGDEVEFFDSRPYLTAITEHSEVSADDCTEYLTTKVYGVEHCVKASDCITPDNSLEPPPVLVDGEVLADMYLALTRGAKKTSNTKSTTEAKTIMATAKALGASIEDYSVKAVVTVNSNPDNSEPAFSVDGDLLANALSKLTRITDSPLYIRASDNALELKAHGGKFVVSKFISEGFQTISAGEFIIPCKGAKMLAKVIGDARYTFTVKKHTLTIDGDDKVLKLKLEQKADALKPFNFECVESGNVLTLAKSELKHLLDSTLYAVAKELTLPIFTAVNFKVENDSLILSATNMARLAMATTQSFSVQGEFNCNIDSAILRFIMPLLKSKDDVQITFAPPCDVRISLGDFDINARCVEGNFPNCTKAIPKLSPVSATVNRAELQGALKLCKGFADVHNAISLCFLDGELEVSAEKIDVVNDVAIGGSALVHLQAEVIGVGNECALANFNVDWLLEMLKTAGTTSVVLGLSESGITMRQENLVAVLCAMKDTVKLPEQKPAIAPPIPENVTTVDVEAKVVA